MLVLPADLTHANARVCAHMLTQTLASSQAQAETSLVADASQLQRFDSSALAVLLECRREAQLRGKSFSVRGLPTRLRSLAVLYGVGELLPTAP
jgi:phospholipid transport system transporter-binding protein